MRIFPKLLVSFLAVSLFPLLIVTLFNYNRLVYQYKEEKLVDLRELITSRIAYTREYFDNMEKRANLLARTENIFDTLHVLDVAINKNGGIHSNAYQEEVRKVETFFRYLVETFGLGDTYLINNQGRIVYSLSKNKDLGENVKTGSLQGSELSKAFLSAEASLDSQISAFSLYEPTGKPVIFVTAPIFVGSRFEGVFALQIPPTEIYKVFHNYTSLQKSGEILIAKKEGDHILFVNPIRQAPDAAFSLKVPLGSNLALPMQDAAQGGSGEGESVDYTGKGVLAVWEFFPELQLGIVVKMDLKEVLAPLNYLRNLTVSVGAGTILLVTLIVIGLVKAFSRPITELRHATEEVRKGNLQTSFDIKSRDELGDLADNFSAMLEHLRESTTSIEALNKEIEERKKIEQTKTEMLSRISHELRTPIGPISEGIQLVLEGKAGQLDERQKEFLELSKRNVARLLSLVNDILSVQDLEVGKEQLNLQEEDINALIQEAVRTKEEEAKKKGLSLQLELGQNLPKVWVDKKKILQLIESLLENAIKFTEKGEILLQTSQQEEEIQVSIKDKGIGINGADISKLFQKFRELEMKTPEKKQGVGLGLVLCKRIVESHKGRIWAESKQGEGSTFHFSLPIKKG